MRSRVLAIAPAGDWPHKSLRTIQAQTLADQVDVLELATARGGNQTSCIASMPMRNREAGYGLK
jgi:hypothetical protein